MADERKAENAAVAKSQGEKKRKKGSLLHEASRTNADGERISENEKEGKK